MRQLLLPLGLLAIAVVGLQGYLWWQFHQRVTSLVELVRPFADIDYSYEMVWLWGSAELHDVSVTLVGRPDPLLTIATLRASSDQWWSLLAAQLGPQKEGLALDQARFSVEGLKLPLTVLKEWNIQTADPYIPVVGPMACGDVTQITAARLEEMGYREFEIDMAVSYRLDRRREQLGFELVYQNAGMMELQLEGEMALPAAALADANANPLLDPATGLPGPLKRVELAVIDRGYIERKKRFCTLRTDEFVESFLVKHAQSTANNLAKVGLELSRGAIDAYRQFFTEGGRIDAQFQPQPEAIPQLFSGVGADASGLISLGNLLGIEEVRVNGLLISDFDIALAPEAAFSAEVAPPQRPNRSPSVASLAAVPVLGALLPRPADASTDSAPEEPAAAPSEVETAAVDFSSVSPKSFQTVAVNELGNYIGVPARILVLNRRVPYLGNVESINDDKVEMRIRYRGGSAIFFLPFDRIVRAEVMQ